MIASLALLWAPPASAEPLDIQVDQAVQVHVTNQGLRHVGDAVENLVPDALSILDGAGSFECDDSTAITYTLDAFDVLMSADEVALEATDGVLTLTLFATLDSDPTVVSVAGDCAILTDLDETCGLQLPTTGLEASFTVAIASTPTGFDADVSDVSYAFTPMTNPLDDCLLASAVGTLVGQNPDAIGDLLGGALGPALEDLGPVVEEALENALNALAIETEIDLLGNPMSLSIDPASIAIDDTGLVMGLSAGVGLPEVATCAASMPPPALSGAPFPLVAETAPGTSLDYDLGVQASRDLTDAILYALMASGTLCIEVDELNGAPLTSDLIGAFFGGELVEITGEGAPTVIVIEPGPPPTTWFDGDQPVINSTINQMAVSLVADVDYRAVRVATVDVTADLGIDVDLVDGELTAGLAIDGGSIVVEERPSAWLSPGYGIGVADLVDFALGGFLPDDLLPTIVLPDLLGVELSRLIWLPSDDGDWQSAYTVVDASGVEPLVLEGCDVSGIGCDGGSNIDFDISEVLGCEGGGSSDCGGCTSVTVPARVLPVWAILPLIALRRRQRRR